jgi:hypothetical protein
VWGGGCLSARSVEGCAAHAKGAARRQPEAGKAARTAHEVEHHIEGLVLVHLEKVLAAVVHHLVGAQAGLRAQQQQGSRRARRPARRLQPPATLRQRAQARRRVPRGPPWGAPRPPTPAAAPRRQAARQSRRTPRVSIRRGAHARTTQQVAPRRRQPPPPSGAPWRTRRSWGPPPPPRSSRGPWPPAPPRGPRRRRPTAPERACRGPAPRPRTPAGGGGVGLGAAVLAVLVVRRAAAGLAPRRHSLGSRPRRPARLAQASHPAAHMPPPGTPSAPPGARRRPPRWAGCQGRGPATPPEPPRTGSSCLQRGARLRLAAPAGAGRAPGERGRQGRCAGAGAATGPGVCTRPPAGLPWPGRQLAGGHAPLAAGAAASQGRAGLARANRQLQAQPPSPAAQPSRFHPFPSPIQKPLTAGLTLLGDVPEAVGQGKHLVAHLELEAGGGRSRRRASRRRAAAQGGQCCLARVRGCAASAAAARQHGRRDGPRQPRRHGVHAATFWARGLWCRPPLCSGAHLTAVIGLRHDARHVAAQALRRGGQRGRQGSPLPATLLHQT